MDSKLSFKKFVWHPQHRFIAQKLIAIANRSVASPRLWLGPRPLSIFPALILFLSGVALAVIPPASVSQEIELDGDDRVAGDLLVLLQPEEAVLNIENRLGTSGNGVWDFGTFQVHSYSGELVVRDNRKPVIQPSELSIPFRNGTKVRIDGKGHIEVQEGTRIFQRVADFQTVVTRFPTVVGNWKPDVGLVVPESRINQGSLRSIALVFSMFAFVVLIRSLFGWLRERTTSRFTRPAATTVGVAIAALLSAFLSRSQYDEGWILHRSEAFLARGYFGNIYSVSDASLVQGNWLEALYSLAILLGFEHIHFRLFLVIVNVLNWILIRRLILFLLRGAGYDQWRVRAEISAAVSFSVVNFVFSSAIRPESLLALLFTFFLVCLVLYFQALDPVWLLLASLSSAIAITVHQSALAFVPAIAVAFLHTGMSALRNPRQEERISTLRDASRIAFMSFSAFLVLLHSFQDFPSLAQNYALWSDSSNHQYGGFSGEIGRYREMLDDGGSHWVLAFGVIGFSVLGLLGAIVRKVHMYFFIAAGLAPFGLLLTASKWPWHLGVLSASATLFWAAVAVMVGYLSGLTKGRKLAASIGFAAIFSFLLRGATPPILREDFGDWLVSLPIPDFLRQTLPVDLDLALLLSAFEIALGGFAWFLLLALGIRIGAGALALILLMTLSVGVIYGNSRGQVGPEWFEPRDRISQFFKGGHVDSCGVYSDSLLVSSISPLDYLTNSGPSLRKILDSVASEVTQDAVQEFRIRTNSSYSDESEMVTPMNQQLFPLHGRFAASNYGLWFFGTGEVTPEVAIEFLGPSKEVISREAFYLSRTDGWEMRVFQSTTDAKYLRVTTPVLNPELNLVSPVFQIEFSPSAVELQGKNFFDGPRTFQFASCAQKVLVTGRLVSGVNFFSGQSFPRDLEGAERLIQISFPGGPKVYSWDSQVSSPLWR